MTALEWHQRLRLMSRCSIVELKPSEAGELADSFEALMALAEHFRTLAGPRAQALRSDVPAFVFVPPKRTKR